MNFQPTEKRKKILDERWTEQRSTKFHFYESGKYELCMYAPSVRKYAINCVGNDVLLIFKTNEVKDFGGGSQILVHQNELHYTYNLKPRNNSCPR